MRARIRQIESGAITPGPQAKAGPPARRWTLGVPEIDMQLGTDGLDCGGVHEIRSAGLPPGMTAIAAAAARRTFALLLAARRIQALDRPGRLLWCLPPLAAQEAGAAYSRGLAALGLDPDRVLIACPPRADDLLWVIEEAVKASCLSLVLGEVRALDTTAARRLSLAAAQARTPCILVSLANRMPVTVSATRWNVMPRISGEAPLDPLAPGPRRFSLALERCRARPLVSAALEFSVEWSDAARCFHMAAAVPDRTPAPMHAPLVPCERPRRVA